MEKIFNQKSLKFATDVAHTGSIYTAGVVHTGINNDTSSTTDKFTAGVIYTSGKFAPGVVVTDGAPWFASKWNKNLITLLLFSAALGKMIHEKNLNQKISCHCPFNVYS